VAFPTAVNNQITDSITPLHNPDTSSILPVNPSIIEQAPALSTAFIYQATAQAIATAAHNATAAQQQTQILAQAVATQCVATLLADDPTSLPTKAETQS
jgi:hypothetical protein